MHILFDKGSSQVQVDLETGGARLATLFAAIETEGWTHAIGPDRISRPALGGVDCLVILTRHSYTAPGTTNPFPNDWDFAYKEEELLAIEAFERQGGGLVLISNHGPFAPGDVDWTVHDRVLAARLNVTIVPAAFRLPSGRLTMSGSDLNLRQDCVLAGVTSIVPHNSCGVSTPRREDVIAHVPANATSLPGWPNGPDGQSYAVHHRRNIIVAGNSGIAGSAGTPFPGAGMIEEGSNKQFLLNCFRCVEGRRIE